jgi:hypothetical protein
MYLIHNILIYILDIHNKLVDIISDKPIVDIINYIPIVDIISYIL